MVSHSSKYLTVLFIFGFFLTACTNINPITPKPPYSTIPPSDQPSQISDLKDYIVTYNYSDTEPVQLSANNLVLKIGQRLELQPAAGLTQGTRFTSSGEYFWGDIMQQTTEPSTNNAVFTATKAGKGKLTIIPNNTDTDRATDLWVTVQ